MSNVFFPVKSPGRRRGGAPRHLEALEPRTLLSAVITSYTPSGVVATGGAYDSGGNLWVYDQNSAALERLVNGAVDTAPGSVIPLDTGTYGPVAFAIGANDHLYMADAKGGIDDVTLGTGAITQTLFTTPGAADRPTALTVTGSGAVWFVGQGSTTTDADNVMHHTSVIGRFDPAAASVSEYATGASLDDSAAVLIAGSGADSVWIGLGAVDAKHGIGTNRIASASYTTAIQLDNAWAVNTGGTIPDNTDTLTSVVGAADGSVWFALANISYSTALQRGPDQIVHGVVNGSSLGQTTSVVTDPATGNPLGVSGLAFDADGKLWFTEATGPDLGYLNPATAGAAPSYTFAANTTGFAPYQTLVNAAGTQLSIVTTTDDFFISELPIIQIDLAVPQQTFQVVSQSNIQTMEDTPIQPTLLATFTAPAGSYTAFVDWGDGTTSNVPATLNNDTGAYEIWVSGKSFATQSGPDGYGGTITVNDAAGFVGGLTFVSYVGDIPLNVTSFAATPIFLRIVTAVGSFTDDGDLALSTWHATITWGDGATSTGLIIRDPRQAGHYLVLGLHQYRTRGPFTMTLDVTTSEQDAAITKSELKTTVVVR